MKGGTMWCNRYMCKVSLYESPFTGQTTIGSGTQLDLLMMGIKISQATFSTQCTHLATRLSSITTATTGQTTTGSGTQSDLLMMGIKMPETY